MQKLQQLPQLRHQPSPDFDVQMSTSNTAMIIFVQGKVQVWICMYEVIALIYSNPLFDGRSTKIPRYNSLKYSSWSPSPQDNIISTTIYSVSSMAKHIQTHQYTSLYAHSPL